jgi:hypothetical protein
MKRVFVAAAAAAFGAAIYLPAAFAGATGSGAVTSQVPSQAPRYEWRYHYVGHHARYEGHWVLVP